LILLISTKSTRHPQLILRHDMLRSVLLSSLAAAAIAAAAPAATADTPYLSTMAFDIGEDAVNPDSPNPVYLPVVLATNGTAGTYVLKGERPSVYTGTPFYYVGYTPAPTVLYFVIDGIKAGAQVPETGNGSVAFAAPILAIAGSDGDGDWTGYNDFVEHFRIPSGQDFYACDGIVEGEPADVVSWGIDGPGGESPTGCKKTKIMAGSYNAQS
jgi:hypothetical protein